MAGAIADKWRDAEIECGERPKSGFGSRLNFQVFGIVSERGVRRFAAGKNPDFIAGEQGIFNGKNGLINMLHGDHRPGKAAQIIIPAGNRYANEVPRLMAVDVVVELFNRARVLE